ncbi:glycosyltransferase involved in cell wall biosynthesis [Actinomycetospora succinea]|uniref:Glycosyltransferase involved in cell wall biosynthesis n=1 Tax=Actinomycetospora succinea TaxID=663603 RepID=A0A4V3D7Q9_9PSEU|nr:glycosyltransferase [Actinomycetospora succinea]TDQ48877.1 glycosyltransferase involved in cell wall biosynthesis [Actinomycetospora succinea]
MHYPPEHTGNAPYTAGMVSALAEAGHRVRVVTGYPHYPQWSVHEGYFGLRYQDADGGVPVTRVRHPVPRDPSALRRVVMDATFAAHAAAVGRQGARRPDVVIAVSPVLLTVLAGLRWRKPGLTALGVVTQDLYSRAVSETGIASAGAGRAAAKLEGWLLKQADGVAVVHDQFADGVARLGVDRDRVTVIRNWSHVASGAGDRSATRRALGWRDDEVIVLHAGNMGLKQGLENVVDTARLADERGADVRFVLLGDGNQRSALEERGEGVGRLQFRDPLPGDHFSDALAAADVLLVNEAPTVAEMSVPSKLTSYFTAGRPVVAATWERSAASAEIRRSGGGVRVDPGSPQDLLDAVRGLAGDPARIDALATAGRAYAEEHLGAAAAHRDYQRWVEDLAASRASEGGTP